MENINRLHNCKTDKGRQAVQEIANQLPEGDMLRILRETSERLYFCVLTGTNGARRSKHVPAGAKKEANGYSLALEPARKPVAKKKKAKLKAGKKPIFKAEE